MNKQCWSFIAQRKVYMIIWNEKLVFKHNFDKMVITQIDLILYITVFGHEWGSKVLRWQKLASFISAWYGNLVRTYLPASRAKIIENPCCRSCQSLIIFSGCYHPHRAASCLWQMRSVTQWRPAESWTGRSWCTRKRWQWKPTESLKSSRNRRDSKGTASN